MIFWSKCIALGLQRYKKVWKTIYNKGVEYEVLRYFQVFLWWQRVYSCLFSLYIGKQRDEIFVGIWTIYYLCNRWKKIYPILRKYKKQSLNDHVVVVKYKHYKLIQQCRTFKSAINLNFCKYEKNFIFNLCSSTKFFGLCTNECISAKPENNK